MVVVPISFFDTTDILKLNLGASVDNVSMVPAVFAKMMIVADYKLVIPILS